MTTHPSIQTRGPSTEQFNYSSEVNNTESKFGNLSYDNSTPLDYLYEEEPMLSDYMEFRAALWINKYYLYIICAIGVPGNIACIATLTQMKPFLSYAVYMLLLAVSDMVSITIKMVYFQITANDVKMGDIFCQLILFLGTVAQQYSNWILVAMTVERFVAIWFPFKVKKICTKRNVALANIVMIVVFICANWHFLLTFEEVADPLLVWDCRPKPNFAYFINVVWYWIDGTLYAFLPIILIVVLNGLIVYAVKRATNTRIDLTNNTKKARDKAAQQRQMTIMLLTISMVFIVLVLPNCIFFIVKEYWTWKNTLHGTAQYFLLYQIVFVLSDLNHAVNFYLYCLSGKRFRHNFLKVICISKRRHSAVESQSCYATVEQSNRAADETSLTNLSPISSPHHQLQACNSSDSFFGVRAQHVGYI